MYSLLLLSSRDIVLASKVGGMVPHFFLLLCEVNSRKSLEFIQIIICSSRNLLGLDYALRNSPEIKHNTQLDKQQLRTVFKQ